MRFALPARVGSRGVVLIALAAFVAYEAIALSGPWNALGMVQFRHPAVATMSAFSAVACGRRARFERGRVRWAWWALSASAAFFSAHVFILAYSVYVTQEFQLGVEPIHQRLYVTSLVFTWIGLLALAGRSRLSSRVLAGLDALIIAGSCLFVGWVVALGRVYESKTLPADQRLATLFWVGGLLVDVALVLIVAVRWEGNRRTLAMLALAYTLFLIMACSFVLWFFSRMSGPTDLEFLGYLLIALAAADRSAAPADEPTGLRRQWRLAMALPFVCTLAVAGSIVVVVATGRPLHAFLGWLGATLGVLILTRLFLTVLENRAITADLEARVAERTEQLHVSRERFRSLVQNSSDVIAVVDGAGLLTYVSPAVRAMLGYADDELSGSPFLALVHPSDRDPALRRLQSLAAGGTPAGTVSCRLARPDGSWCQVEAMLSPLRVGQVRSVVLNIRDVTERAAFEQQLRHQALHDVLTTLANRRLFNERVRHALDRAERTGEDLAILYIDLDNFKRLNDSEGHGAGDELLVAVAARLSECLRPADTAARLGGDEFGVLLEGTGLDEAAVVAQRIVTSLAAPHRFNDRDISLGASVGVAGCRGGSVDYDTLLRDADLAMYQAKATGRGRYVVFDPQMHARLLLQVELEAGLREAIAENGLQLHYQPILNLLTCQITGVEALTRWSRPEQGAVPPSLFIPLAEESDLILSLDRWVLEQTCRQVRAWQLRYPRHAELTASINFSALELRDSTYCDAVATALASSGLAARDVTLEVTETAILPEHPASLDRLTALRELGVRISLDDFGTGYSSLATLRQLPLDEIKIDGSFVEGIQDSKRGYGIVKAIVELAEALEVQTVAEWIESHEQLMALRALRCGSGQGYLFAPSMPFENLESVLDRGLTALQVPPTEVARLHSV